MCTGIVSSIQSAAIDAIRTPNKYGQLLIAPSYKKGAFDSHAVDGPFPFFHDGTFWMTYIGWDGVGYQTGLASSRDLLNWRKEGLLLGRGPAGSVTEHNAAMTCILRDNDLFGPGTLKQAHGRFLGTYHAYPEPGYEAGPAVIGLCFSDDLRSWEVGPPILAPDPSCEWEAGGLYKSWLVEWEGVYYIFYNAKDRTHGRSAAGWNRRDLPVRAILSVGNASRGIRSCGSEPPAISTTGLHLTLACSDTTTRGSCSILETALTDMRGMAWHSPTTCSTGRKEMKSWWMSDRLAVLIRRTPISQGLSRGEIGCSISTVRLPRQRASVSATLNIVK